MAISDILDKNGNFPRVSSEIWIFERCDCDTLNPSGLSELVSDIRENDRYTLNSRVYLL